MEHYVYFLYLSHLLYGICVNIFIMNRYFSKSYTTSKNTIDRQSRAGAGLQCQLLLVLFVFIISFVPDEYCGMYSKCGSHDVKDPQINGGLVSKKTFFWLFGLSLVKIRHCNVRQTNYNDFSRTIYSFYGLRFFNRSAFSNPF